MKLFTNLRNKFTTMCIALSLLVLASLGLFNLCTPSSVDASMIKFDNESTITITNGSFTNFSSSSSYPYALSSYSTSGNSTPNMKTGAINIGDSDYAKNYSKYGLTEYGNPKGVGSDNYILMINADKDSNYTYTSSEFTLPANGHYYITVSAKTLGDNAIASVFLTQNGVIFEDCIIENITSSTWSNYTFFVTTNSYESVRLKFNMQIGNQSGGASGCVLFDELHAGQISSETLNSCLSTFATDSYKYAEFATLNAYKEYNFDNKVITYTRNSKGEIVYENGVATYSVEDKNYFNKVTSGVGEKNFDISNNILTLTTNNTYLTYKGEEEVLDANSTYRFSIFVNASQLTSGSAFVQVDEIVEEGDVYDDFMDSTTTDNSAKSSNLTISSVTSNTVTNGYVEYVIYVRTGVNQTSTVQFSFGLGTDSENATGQVSFKSYKIERVPYSAYSSASTGDTLGKIDISERLSLSSDEFSNFTFDQMQSESFDGIAYPATPTSWTKDSDGVGYQLSGVVNLSEFSKVMTKYSSAINTMATPSALGNSLNNNVLMIYNGTSATHSYESSNKTLSANKYYKITAFVNTYLWNSDANGVTIVAKTGTNVLGQVSNIKTAGEWQRVVMYINTPSNTVDLTLELALGYGQNTSSGYAFFDNILVEEADTANDFSNRFSEYTVATNGEVTLDLTNPMLTSTTTREYNVPVLYDGTNNGETTINAGVVDLTSDLKMIAESKREALRSLDADNKNVLAIVTALEEDGYYEYTSVINYTFASGTYYKLSFSLFTDGISQEAKEDEADMYDNGVLAEGVNIELTNLENAKFSYIQSDGKWTNYEIYIGIKSSTTSNLIFSLGSEFTGCYGKAFLGNIVLEEVEEADFTSVTASDTILKVDTVETDEDEDPETTEKSGNNFSWAYIPTILTFLAIVVAVVGIFMRRNMKFKKHSKNKKAEYDRDITVMQNKYRRMAIDTREKEIRELTKERDKLIDLRSEYEEKYKDALSRLRSARLANRDGSKRHEIVAIEHEVKHISKEVARFGVQVNNYDNEIEFMQTEAYLIDLEKRMAREGKDERSQALKEANMDEEELQKSVAKREAKQARIEAKAQAKADKLASKQAKLVAKREEVQKELAQAKEMDEKYAKEQELKQLRLQEQQIAKEKAKAEQELKKLEQQRVLQEATKPQENAETNANALTTSDESAQDASEVQNQEKIEEVNNQSSEQQEVNPETTQAPTSVGEDVSQVEAKVESDLTSSEQSAQTEQVDDNKNAIDSENK